MATITEENYLKALFHLSSEEGSTTLSRLSSFLDISKPTANSMVKNLKEQGLVSHEKYKPIKLTEKGKKTSALILRKHRLTEMYLVEKMEFGWEEVHEIAEQIEHIKSPAFFDRMDEIMDYPKIDPHGSPIPDKNGNILDRNHKPLSYFNTGDKLKLEGLNNSSKVFLEYLDGQNIHLGLELAIKKKESFDGSIIVEFGGKKVSLSEQVCSNLLVTNLKSG